MADEVIALRDGRVVDHRVNQDGRIVDHRVNSGQGASA
jgi:hypothetical protein